MPTAWANLNHKQLVKQVFAYTRDTIAAFAQQGLMPDMVQVGNEITNGMLWPVSFFDNLITRHVQFAVIGLSYYPYWHGDLPTMQSNLRKLALRYRRPIIVVETAYNWTPGRAGKSQDFPETPQGQLAFLRAVDAAVRAIPNGLGQGVFWWEPAAEGGLRGRSFFDNDGNVFPVIAAFDTP